MTTNKSIAAAFTSSAVAHAERRDEIRESNLANVPSEEAAAMSQRSTLGLSGLKMHCHSVQAAYLSGMTAPAVKIFKELGITAAEMANTPEAGGFNREHKNYTYTACEAIAQGKRPGALDMTAISNAAKAIDPKYPTKRTGHNTINELIDQLKESASWTVDHWAAVRNGETQANYISAYLKKLGAAKVTGSKGLKTTTVDLEHPLIKGLLSIA